MKQPRLSYEETIELDRDAMALQKETGMSFSDCWKVAYTRRREHPGNCDVSAGPLFEAGADDRPAAAPGNPERDKLGS